MMVSPGQVAPPVCLIVTARGHVKALIEARVDVVSVEVPVNLVELTVDCPFTMRQRHRSGWPRFVATVSASANLLGRADAMHSNRSTEEIRVQSARHLDRTRHLDRSC